MSKRSAMRQIPKFNIFNKQEFGGNWDSVEECLQYAALYMHTWNLLEWIMANIISADNNVNDGKSVEEIWATFDLPKKCERVNQIYEHQNENPNRDSIVTLVDQIKDRKDSCRDLRDTIAHSHVYWVISMGVYQEQTGWLRLRRNENGKNRKLHLKEDEKATEEWKTALSNSSNPDITADEINTPIYTTYGKSEIISELEKLMNYVRLFDYNPLSDRVVNHYWQKWQNIS